MITAWATARIDTPGIIHDFHDRVSLGRATDAFVAAGIGAGGGFSATGGGTGADTFTVIGAGVAIGGVGMGAGRGLTATGFIALTWGDTTAGFNDGGGSIAAGGSC